MQFLFPTLLYHTFLFYALSYEIKKHEQGLDVSTDMWNEKIGDSINYLLLLTALIVEDRDMNGVEVNKVLEERNDNDKM